MNKTITLLGSTGSIGTQSLDVARMHGYSVFGLAANSSVDKLLEQINEFHPKYVAVVNPDAYAKLSAALAGQADAPKLLQGAEGLRELAAMDGPDVVLNAVVGIAGLPASLAAQPIQRHAGRPGQHQPAQPPKRRRKGPAQRGHGGFCI